MTIRYNPNNGTGRWYNDAGDMLDLISSEAEDIIRLINGIKRYGWEYKHEVWSLDAVKSKLNAALVYLEEESK